VTLTPRRLDEVLRTIFTVGEAIGVEAEAQILTDRLRDRVADAARRRPSPEGRVVVLEWTEPPIAAGLWVPEMIRAAGGTGLLADRDGEVGTRVDWSSVANAAPDLVVVSPCSFPIERTRSALEGRPEVAGWVDRMRPRRGVWIADEAYFSRPGPRLADGVELLADLLAGVPPRAPMPVERRLSPAVPAPAS
jgi:iron complex transport system substrate-binding protein